MPRCPVKVKVSLKKTRAQQHSVLTTTPRTRVCLTEMIRNQHNHHLAVLHHFFTRVRRSLYTAHFISDQLLPIYKFESESLRD